MMSPSRWKHGEIVGILPTLLGSHAKKSVKTGLQSQSNPEHFQRHLGILVPKFVTDS